MTQYSLELRNISKRFGPVQALADAHLALRAGEVHALLGENGAGKSTLMHIAAGMMRPDSGTIHLTGTPQTFGSLRAARRAGIGLVHQHFTSIAALTVAENMALFAGWAMRPKTLRARVATLTEELRLPLDPDARTGSLPVALRQRLELAQALATDARILLLDEPTAVLAPSEADALLERLRDFAKAGPSTSLSAGRSVVLITHKLDEALRVADRVTVLQRGRVVLETEARWTDAAKLADAMLGVRGLPRGDRGEGGEGGEGRHGVERSGAPALFDAPVRVRVKDVSVLREDGSVVAIEGASIEVLAGEIVAIAGVEGSGQRELLRAMAGLLPIGQGTLDVSHPIAFVPEDRTTEALIAPFTLTENIVLGAGAEQPWRNGNHLDWSMAERRTGELLSEFDVRAPGPQVLAATLSGGNQQKLVLARALERRPRVLIAENPARGLDIAATAAVHARLRQAAEEGVAVVVYSSDLDEVLALGQRIVVAARGRLIEAPAGADKATIGALMLGQEQAG